MDDVIVAVHFDLHTGGMVGIACDGESVLIRTERGAEIHIVEWPIQDTKKIVDAVMRLLQQYH